MCIIEPLRLFLFHQINSVNTKNRLLTAGGKSDIGRQKEDLLILSLSEPDKSK